MKYESFVVNFANKIIKSDTWIHRPYRKAMRRLNITVTQLQCDKFYRVRYAVF